MTLTRVVLSKFNKMTNKRDRNEFQDKRTTKKDRLINKSKEDNDDLIFIRRIACRTRQRRKTNVN